MELMEAIEAYLNGQEIEFLDSTAGNYWKTFNGWMDNADCETLKYVRDWEFRLKAEYQALYFNRYLNKFGVTTGNYTEEKWKREHKTRNLKFIRLLSEEVDMSEEEESKRDYKEES